jgi:hypothetical protein
MMTTYDELPSKRASSRIIWIMLESWVAIVGWIAYLIALVGIVLIVREIRENGFAFARRGLPNSRSLLALLLGMIGLGLRQWLGWKYGFQWPPWLFTITAVVPVIAWLYGYAPPHVRSLRAAQRYLASIRGRLYQSGSPAPEPEATAEWYSAEFDRAERNLRLAFEGEEQGKLSDAHHIYLDSFAMPTTCFVCG